MKKISQSALVKEISDARTVVVRYEGGKNEYKLFRGSKEEDFNRLEEEEKIDVYNTVYDLRNVNEIEKRISPAISGITKAQFVLIKQREQRYEQIIKENKKIMQWLKAFKSTTKVKYEYVFKRFLYFSLDFYFDSYDKINFERINEYIEFCIKKQLDKTFLNDSVNVLKTFCIVSKICHESDFEVFKNRLRTIREEEERLNENEIQLFKDNFSNEVYRRKNNETFKKNFFYRNRLGEKSGFRRIIMCEILFLLELENRLTIKELVELKLDDFEKINAKQVLLKQKKKTLKLSNELSEKITKYIEYRKEFDYDIYQSKIFAAVFKMRSFNTPAGEEIDYKDICSSETILHLKELKKMREETKYRQNIFRKHLTEKQKKCEHIIEKAELAVLLDKKIEKTTKETYEEIDYFVINQQSKKMSEDALRKLLDSYIYREVEVNTVTFSKNKRRMMQTKSIKNAGVNNLVRKFDETIVGASPYTEKEQ